MTASTSDRRRTATRVIATILAVSAVAFGLVTVVLGIILPEQAPHAWHNAMVATLLIVVAAPPAIAVARSPGDAQRALTMLAAVAVAAVATMALSLTLDPFTLPFVIGIGVLWLLRPPNAPIVAAGRPGLLLALLVIVAAAPLVAYAVGQAELQRVDHASQHAAFFHWVEASFTAIAILLLGLLAALRPRTYRLAGLMAGAALGVLGASSILLGSYASAFTGIWAWASLAWGVAFLAVMALERRSSPAS